IYRRNATRNWSIKFYVDGKLRRETAGTPDEEQARAFLKRRVAEATAGLLVALQKRPTFADLRAMLVENDEFKRNRTDPGRFVDRLETFFGGMKAEDITQERIAEYSRRRLKI